MKIFISYGMNDEPMVRQIADFLKPHAEVVYWSESKMPGNGSWETIFGWIDSSDIVLVLITGNTVARAMAVGQEVGHAKAKYKTIIPLVSREISPTELGFLSGITYQPVDRFNMAPALEALKHNILARKQKAEETKQLFLLFGGIIAFFYVASS